MGDVVEFKRKEKVKKQAEFEIPIYGCQEESATKHRCRVEQGQEDGVYSTKHTCSRCPNYLLIEYDENDKAYKSVFRTVPGIEHFSCLSPPGMFVQEG